MPVPRFYLPRPAAGTGEAPLPADEARHLRRVLRLGAGAHVRVFDGQGHEHDATVVEAGPRQVTVRLGAPVAPRAESRVTVTLAVTLLRGRKLDTVVRDATMLGVSGITPLRTDRGQVGGVRRDDTRRAERWHQIAVASAKQCGRAVVPVIHDPMSLAAYLDPGRPATDRRLLLVEPGAAPAMPALTPAGADGPARRPAAATIAVGPEGGWTATEIEMARAAGFSLVTFGTCTLRADAAPIVALSVLRFLWRDL